MYQCTSWAAVAVLTRADPGVDSAPTLAAALGPGGPGGPEDGLRTGHPIIAEPANADLKEELTATATQREQHPKIQVRQSKRCQRRKHRESAASEQDEDAGGGGDCSLVSTATVSWEQEQGQVEQSNRINWAADSFPN